MEANGPSGDAPTPRQRERRMRMVAAMRRAVIARGYAATSLDHVIHEVGGSRRTIYAEFGGKAGLMSAVVEEVVSDVAAAVDLFYDPSAGPRAWLVRVGTQFTRRILSPDAVAVLREVVAMGVGPDEARAFWAAGPDRLRASLADWLRARDAEGVLHVPDPEAAADILPEMMRGPLLVERLAGLRGATDAAAITRQVEAAVDLFLAGAWPRADDPATPPAGGGGGRGKV